ncbi:MAG: sulfotransferase [Chloroflexota bacterium]
MQARSQKIRARFKPVKGTVAIPQNFLAWGGTEMELPDTLPQNITPYALDYNKREVVMTETPSDYNLIGEPFLYHEQFKNAQNIMRVSYDDWFAWMREQPMPEKPIFICGIGRSGTTLITRALDRLPQTLVYDEPDVYMQMVRLQGEEQRNILQASTASFNQHGTRLAIKHRSFVSYMMDTILDVYPDAKVLFMYRSTIPWVLSNMRLILRTPAPRGVVHEIVRYFFKRYLPHLNPADFRPLRMVEAGALLWLEFLGHYVELREKGYDILGVRYEDLIAAPESVMSQIFDYCELPQSQVPEALKAFDRNSQKGTIFSRDQLGDVKLTEKQRGYIMGMLERHEWLNDPHIRLSGSVVPVHKDELATATDDADKVAVQGGD